MQPAEENEATCKRMTTDGGRTTVMLRHNVPLEVADRKTTKPFLTNIDLQDEAERPERGRFGRLRPYFRPI